MKSRAALIFAGMFLAVTALVMAWTRTQGAAEPASPGYRNLSATELWEKMAKKDFLLINVHVPYEGHIPGTDLEIPFDRIRAAQDKLPANKDAPIVVYCMSGRMSQIAAETLVAMGYRNVSQLAGGMLAWRQAGFPLEHRPR